MSNVVFLLGAGVSIPAGMPSTKDITDCVNSGTREVRTRTERVVRTGMDSYKFSASPTVYEINDPHVPTIMQLLRILRQSLSDLYGDEQDNYEALFYALRAAIDGKEARTRDPSTIYFWRGISAAIESLPIAAENLLDFLYEAQAYIYHVVWGMLVREPSRLDHINCIIDGCRDQDTSRMTIASLNHDTVIEQALRSNGLDYVDGFGPPDGVERHWSPRSFDEPCSNIVLLKLHGSVDLTEYRDQKKNERKIVTSGAHKQCCSTRRTTFYQYESVSVVVSWNIQQAVRLYATAIYSFAL